MTGPATAAASAIPSDPAELVREVLEEYGAAARIGLARYIGGGEPRRHLYDLTADYPTRGGRSLRASLCIATGRVFGASLEEAINSAVALELLHNAFLVHDDIEDESEERRGRPTLHQLHGVPLAINAGDALAVMSLRPLMENRRTLGPALALRILEEAERMARESVEGQAIELGWRRDNVVDLGEHDYLHMILKKTCWYTTIYPCRVGALIGSRDGVDLDRYLRYAFFLGASFQIEDDLLNLTGDPVRYGKEINGDILEGKRTLMLIRLFQTARPAEAETLRQLLGQERGRRGTDDVLWVRRRMEAYDCIGHATRVAHGLAGAARHEFETAFAGLPESRDLAFMRALPTWVIARA
jgi:geranylgeranyl diphosphate synthase type II